MLARHFAGVTFQTLPVCRTSVCNVSIFTKKKNTDTVIEQQKLREARKRRNLAKKIVELEEVSKKLKPIDEFSVEFSVQKSLPERTRELPELSFEESERRAILHKEWARYKNAQERLHQKKIAALLRSQKHALAELRSQSEELYQAAIQIDAQLLPTACPVKMATPAIKDYNSPDGDYTDTTRTYR